MLVLRARFRPDPLSIAMAVLLLTKAIEGHDVAEWWASQDYEKVKLFISKAAVGEGNSMFFVVLTFVQHTNTHTHVCVCIINVRFGRTGHVLTMFFMQWVGICCL